MERMLLLEESRESLAMALKTMTWMTVVMTMEATLTRPLMRRETTWPVLTPDIWPVVAASSSPGAEWHDTMSLAIS